MVYWRGRGGCEGRKGARCIVGMEAEENGGRRTHRMEGDWRGGRGCNCTTPNQVQGITVRRIVWGFTIACKSVIGIITWGHRASRETGLSSMIK